MRKTFLHSLHIGLLMASFVVNGVHANAEPFEGSWSSVKTGCCKAGDDSVIRFHQGRYTAFETACTIKDSSKDVDPVYGPSWRLVMDCESEGETDTAVLWVSEDSKAGTITLTWDRSVADVSADMVFYRCNKQ